MPLSGTGRRIANRINFTGTDGNGRLIVISKTRLSIAVIGLLVLGMGLVNDSTPALPAEILIDGGKSDDRQDTKKQQVRHEVILLSDGD